MAGSSSRNRSSILSRALMLSAPDPPPDAHLRALQELGKIEMRASATVQKLADELNGCVKVLKSWGQVQDGDLEDILFHSANLFARLSAVLVRFASYGGQVWERFELVRERELRLSALRKSRTCVGVKVDAAQKRVDKIKTKLKPKHHIYTACNDHLENLKKQEEQMDVDIPIEAALEDYKRQAARECMERKFAEIVELSNKMRVIGEAGQRIVQEIPLGATPPGDPRAPYTGRERTAALYSQAITDIHRIQVPNNAHSDPYQPQLFFFFNQVFIVASDQPQLDDQSDDGDSRSSGEWTPPVGTFTRSSMPEGSLISAGQQMGEIYPNVISRSTHAPDTASTSGLSSQFRSTSQISFNTSLSALTSASIASPSSIRSTTNGNIQPRRHRRYHSRNTIEGSFQPFGLSQLPRPTSSHGLLYRLPEELTPWTVGSATATTSARE